MDNNRKPIEDIKQMARDGKLIALIKEYRGLTGKGLKDSKDAIETARTDRTDALGSRTFDTDIIEDIFRADCGYDPDPYTKEEFLNNLEQAIDHGQTFRMDMIESVKLYIEKVTENGGINELARERDKFLSRI
jgi:hypothetical protein